ncbi:P-loop containing nucleoside triphosphate hydrolase protein [Panus rudis PR-1116 ss-1]|nr:P-loop containing nucleoside triphosphate hydrolase protein [Panus rudis PR-1116 ss-1]
MQSSICKSTRRTQHVLTHNTRRTYSTRPSLSTSTKNVFGNSGAATFLAAAATPESIPKLHGLPEIIVTGRANVGKSTLLNALLGRKDLLRTSSKPGRTQTLNFYQVGSAPGSLVVVDAPGYGSRGRPEWGDLFNYYVQNREQLKRVYILFNAKHGLNETDKLMLQSLNEQCLASNGARFTLQGIITKADLAGTGARETVQSIQKEIFENASTCLPAIVTAASKPPYFGIEEVRKSIIEACGVGKVGSTIVHNHPS